GRSANLQNRFRPRPGVTRLFRTMLGETHAQIVIIRLARQPPHEQRACQLRFTIITEEPKLVLGYLELLRRFVIAVRRSERVMIAVGLSQRVNRSSAV